MTARGSAGELIQQGVERDRVEPVAELADDLADPQRAQVRVAPQQRGDVRDAHDEAGAPTIRENCVMSTLRPQTTTPTV